MELPEYLDGPLEQIRYLQEKKAEIEEALEERMSILRQLPEGNYYRDGKRLFRSYLGRRFSKDRASKLFDSETVAAISSTQIDTELAREKLTESQYAECQVPNQKVTIEWVKE